MRLLESWTVVHGGSQRTIELLQGDLAALPREHAVDLLVVSAFPNDYLPTSTSVIGALQRVGLSVASLADDKKADLRQEFSCWLSKPVPEAYAFRSILCIESGWRGSPPEITDDLFRALAPYLLTDFPNASVAMPLIGAGDQGWPADAMLKSILTAAVGWIHRGLPLRLLKIVIFAPTAATMARSQFAAIRQEYLAPRGFVERAEKELQASSGWDVFLSYCHTDEEPARLILTSLQARLPAVRVFFDRVNIQKGASWLLHVAESLDYAKRVVALYTPHYWTSPNCKDEFAAALARQNDTGTTVLFPIYLLTAPIPYLFRNLQFADCREGDREKVRFACGTLASEIRNC